MCSSLFRIMAALAILFFVGCGTDEGPNPGPGAGGSMAGSGGGGSSGSGGGSGSDASVTADTGSDQGGSAGAAADAMDVADTMESGSIDAPKTSDGPPAGLQVLMVGLTNGNPSPGDTILINRLKARGFVVTLVSDTGVMAAQAQGKHLILISSSAETTPLGTKVRDVALPIVCLENNAYGVMNMTGLTMGTSFGMTAANSTTVKIGAVAQPLTGTLQGTVTIATKAGELGWGVPGPKAIIAATLTADPTRAAIFGYEQGEEMADTAKTRAPARRAGFAIREVLTANLSPEGLQIFDSIVDWALGYR